MNKKDRLNKGIFFKRKWIIIVNLNTTNNKKINNIKINNI